MQKLFLNAKTENLFSYFSKNFAYGNSQLTSIGSYAFTGCTGLESVTFATTTGLYVGDSEGVTTTLLDSADLANTSTAATYLTSNYVEKYWTRDV